MPYLTMRDGTAIYFEDHGKGKETKGTVVFAHGLASSHLDLWPFISEFLAEYRCVCYDQRGHAASAKPGHHMSIQALARDLHELLEYLELEDVILIGHSLGASTVYDYVRQFGCEHLRKIVGVDMSPCANNMDWRGGLKNGEWTPEEFMSDLGRFFEDVGLAYWHSCVNYMKTVPADSPESFKALMVQTLSSNVDPFTQVAMWFSVHQTDNRDYVKDITVPFMYILPETPMVAPAAAEFIRDNVKSEFVLADGFPGTSHLILQEKPHEVADRVKAFIEK